MLQTVYENMKPRYIAFWLLCICLFPGCKEQEKPMNTEVLKSEIVTDLTQNILPFWMTYAPDPSGGFYGQLSYDGTPVPDAEKGGVLNARILWTFSVAYRLFGEEAYKTMADRAQHYFLDHFIDPEYGGSYWSVQADGTPANVEKQTYGIAYAIYGLAEHYRATGNQQSLDQAVELFRTLETYAYDPGYGGYIESFTRDWQPPERFGYDGKGIAPKTMNTHLHVLEAYSTLYRVWPDNHLKKQLREMIHVFTDKIIDPDTWHEKLFLTRDWQNLEQIDSYGHDMELSWLLTEAAEVLGEKELLHETERIAIRLVDTQMKEGWNDDGSMLYEKEGDHIQKDREWWPQAESVVAFVNAWQITGEERYMDAAWKTWTWIRLHLIDYEYGEWYKTVREDGTPVIRAPKASMWKCPYHNSRMGFEIYTRIR